ncbi:hypothetical protein N9878_01765 [bacterium]|nr:hypothetical protein [bacterium]
MDWLLSAGAFGLLSVLFGAAAIALAVKTLSSLDAFLRSLGDDE